MLVLDLPPGTEDVQLAVLQQLQLSGAVAVSMPSRLATADTIKGLEMFTSLGVPTMAVVENTANYDARENHLSFWTRGDGPGSIFFTLATKSPHRGPVTPETLQHLWGIGHEKAAQTIGTTMQSKGHETAALTIGTTTQSNMKRMTQSKYTSIQKKTCAKGLDGETSTKLCREVDIPTELFCANSKECMKPGTEFAKECIKPGTEFQKVVSHYSLKIRTTEPRTPNQNKIVEGTIGHTHK
jgi:hypothetical protein